MRNCPLCAGKGKGPAFPYKTIWNKKEFGYFACGGCETIFVDPLPTKSDFELMYAPESYHDVHYATLNPQAGRQSLERFQPFCAARRTLLDFGCGNGTFLSVAREVGIQCQGIEFDANMREKAARNSGVPVSGLTGVQASKAKFDIIRLGDVLEHLPDPSSVFHDLAALLNPGGIFWVEGPLQSNASLVFWCATAFKKMRRICRLDRPGTEPPTHLILTNARAQRNFFIKRLQFRCIHFEVYETGWPYLRDKAGPLTQAQRIKHIVGVLSVGFSRLDMRSERRLGNRFMGVFEPLEAKLQ